MKPDITLDNKLGITIALKNSSYGTIRFNDIGCVIKIRDREDKPQCINSICEKYVYEIASNASWPVRLDYLDVIKIAMIKGAEFLDRVKLEEARGIKNPALGVSAITPKNVKRYSIYVDEKGSYFAYLGKGNVIKYWGAYGKSGCKMNAEGQDYVYANVTDSKEIVEHGLNSQIRLTRFKVDTRCNPKRFLRDTGKTLKIENIVATDWCIYDFSQLK